MAVSLNFDLRDESGFLVKHHSTQQREAYLLRNPQMVGKLQPVADPVRPPWNATHVGGRSPEFARESALLRDPLPTRKAPTKPAKPEPEISLYRSSIHECGHVLTCFAFDVPVARMSLIKDGDLLGHIKHANLPDGEAHLAILLGGRAAEIVTFGDERLAGSVADIRDATAMAKRLAGDGAEKLIEKVLGENIDMLRMEKNALRYLAYELINKKQIDFEDTDAAIDRAFVRQANVFAKVATKKDSAVRRSTTATTPKPMGTANKHPKQGRVLREYDFSKQQDIRAWNRLMGHQDLDAEPIGFGVGHIVPGSYR